MTVNLYLGDCLEVMPTLEADSVDSIVTDPPYGYDFMGKNWDHGVPGEHFWREALRVAKPGAHLLAFGGTRTFHRLACAIEDAGFEIRDTVMWVYGSGFPKSCDISKQIDKQEYNTWNGISKAIDNISELSILEAWKEYSSNAKSAGLTFRKSETETGTNTPKNVFAHGNVVLSVSQEKSSAAAILAELSSSVLPLYVAENTPSVLASAEVITEPSLSHARFAGEASESPRVNQDTITSIARCDVKESLRERATTIIRADEALMIWLGSNKSSRQAATNALCAALTDDLKRIILSQSKTFLSLDTIQQTDFVSATSATITESTAASLISSTVDTLKRKAIDKAAGAEREVLAFRKQRANSADSGVPMNASAGEMEPITAPATPDAARWQGFGTALKPAWEPVIVARKPLEGTVAANVQRWGTGAINVDGCRVATNDDLSGGSYGGVFSASRNPDGSLCKAIGSGDKGRWPANLVHDGSEEVMALFPVTKNGGKANASYSNENDGIFTPGGMQTSAFYGDTGSAARFFYAAKASKRDRDEGCEEFELKRSRKWRDDKGMMLTGNGNPRIEVSRNHHPTVKPTQLMRYLVRLVTPPGGVVLDPFMGSGSTGKAAMLEGFSFIGIEIDAEYLEIAKRRIEHVQLPLVTA